MLSVWSRASLHVPDLVKRHGPGPRNFFRSRPALLSTLQPTQLAGVGLALAVVAVAAGIVAVVAAGAVAAL